MQHPEGGMQTIYLLGPCERHRGSFDQASEFDRGRTVADRDCGLSFREIGQRVGRNHATVMQISHRWMQEETTDCRGQSHPSRCTMPVMTGGLGHDSDGSRCHIMNHSTTDEACYASCGVHSYHSTPFAEREMSARHPLLRLSLTGNHRLLRHQ
ncbi:transposable element Tcb1 transposase [Trichonephila clavipes]|nr:transposable element Tcb1 transposase [Trichonephila clavipes]